VPDTIKVPVYPVHERGSMIWTTLSASPVALRDDREPTVALRSIYVDSDIPSALEAFGDARLQPFSSSKPNDITLRRATASLYTLSSGQDTLMVGIQRISLSRIGLHFVYGSSAPPDDHTKLHLLGWTLRLRHAIEQANLSNSANGGASERIR
jgi:hypothetical protein